MFPEFYETLLGKRKLKRRPYFILKGRGYATKSLPASRHSQKCGRVKAHATPKCKQKSDEEARNENDAVRLYNIFPKRK